MGEIIHVDFRSSSIIKSSVEPASSDALDEKTLVKNVFNVLLEMNRFFHRLNVPNNRETRAMREQMIHSMTFREMCSAISNSSERDWQKNPTYYSILRSQLCKSDKFSEYWDKLVEKR